MLPMLFRFVFLSFLLASSVFAGPNIVVSIKPIHSLVSALTQGVTTPKLLLKTNQSPHYMHLLPSQLSILSEADLIVVIHPQFESGFKKILAHIHPSKKFIINSDSISRHSWLEVERMQIFAKKLTQKLIEIDKINTDIYQKNLNQLSQKLKQLKQNISQQFSGYKTQSIALYSNALKYFIESNNLQTPIVINKYHSDRLSIYKIRVAKQAMQKNQTKCLLSTPITPNKRIQILTEGLNVNVAMIDVMGTRIPENAQHYFKTMTDISHQIAQCLK